MTTKKKKTLKSKPLRTLSKSVGIGMLTLLLGFTSYICLWTGFGNSYFICFGSFFPSRASVEHHAYLEFPPSAQNIGYDANGVNRKGGCTIWVKFEMLSTELDTFMQTTYVQDLSSSTRLVGIP